MVADGADGGSEHERAQVGGRGGVENVAQTVDVGAEQGSGVDQPGAGVDSAMEDVVDTVHRRIE